MTVIWSCLTLGSVMEEQARCIDVLFSVFPTANQGTGEEGWRELLLLKGMKLCLVVCP
jgi:hypothetical protein